MKLAIAFLVALQASSGAQLEAPKAPPQGSHGVRNLQYKLFLRPRDASNRDGEAIVLYPFQTWKCMAWKFDNSDKGTRLINFFTGKSFMVAPESNARRVVQMPPSKENVSAESLKFVPLGANLYKIEVAGAPGVLTAVDTDGNGDHKIYAQPWEGKASQKWELTDIPTRFTG